MSVRAARPVLAILLVVALLAGACGSSSSDESARGADDTTSTAAPVGYADPGRWLCRPDLDDDVCATADLTTDAWLPSGQTTREPDTPPLDTGVDCFYVYPTVEIGDAPGNADDLADLALETDAVLAQALRFSTVCDLWAPFYPQVNQLGRQSLDAAALEETAYQGVADAFQAYLDVAGDRPFVLLGHDQGADLLTRLLAERIDGDEALRSRLVSAILAGTGRVVTPPGEPVGGTFQNIPLCGDRHQRGCVIAFNLYGLGSEPSSGSPLYAAVPSGLEVACTNPAGLDGSKGQFRGAYFPRTATDAVHWVPDGLPPSDAPFLKLGEYLRGECRDGPGPVRYVRVDLVTDPADQRNAPSLSGDRVGLGAGLHDHELQIALGDLLFIVESQIEAG